MWSPSRVCASSKHVCSVVLWSGRKQPSCSLILKGWELQWDQQSCLVWIPQPPLDLPWSFAFQLRRISLNGDTSKEVFTSDWTSCTITLSVSYELCLVKPSAGILQKSWVGTVSSPVLWHLENTWPMLHLHHWWGYSAEQLPGAKSHLQILFFELELST